MNRPSAKALIYNPVPPTTTGVALRVRMRSRICSLRSRDGGEGTARVLLDPASGAVAVLGKGLPPPKTGRVYELWAIRSDGKTERAGTLEPRGKRSFAVRLKEVAQPGQVREFAISVEPQGGAEKPSGPMVLVGSVR